MLNESVVFIKVIYSHELSVSLSLQSLHSELYFRFINKRGLRVQSTYYTDTVYCFIYLPRARRFFLWCCSCPISYHSAFDDLRFVNLLWGASLEWKLSSWRCRDSYKVLFTWILKVCVGVRVLAYSIANEVQSYLLNRCSLFRLFHKSGPRKQLDERRRLSMAYDVVCLTSFLYHSWTGFKLSWLLCDLVCVSHRVVLPFLCNSVAG